MLLYIHTPLESLSEPDSLLPPSLPTELAPISPSSDACASSVARAPRACETMHMSQTFTLILLHLTLLLSLDL